MIMVGAEFVPFPEALRPHAIVGASLSFCHLLGPLELSFCQWCGPRDDFLPTVLWEEQVAVAAGSRRLCVAIATMNKRGCLKRLATG